MKSSDLPTQHAALPALSNAAAVNESDAPVASPAAVPAVVSAAAAALDAIISRPPILPIVSTAPLPESDTLSPITSPGDESNTPQVERLSIQPVVTAKSCTINFGFDEDEDEDAVESDFPFIPDMFSPKYPSFTPGPPELTSRVRTEEASPGLESLPTTFDIDQLFADGQFCSPLDTDINDAVGADLNLGNHQVADDHEEHGADISVPQVNKKLIESERKEEKVENTAVQQTSLEENAENGDSSSPESEDYSRQGNVPDDIDGAEEKFPPRNPRVADKDANDVSELKASSPGRNCDVQNADLDPSVAINEIDNRVKPCLAQVSSKDKVAKVDPPPVDAISVSEMKSIGSIGVPKRNIDAKFDGIVPPLKRSKPTASNSAAKEDAPASLRARSVKAEEKIENEVKNTTTNDDDAECVAGYTGQAMASKGNRITAGMKKRVSEKIPAQDAGDGRVGDNQAEGRKDADTSCPKVKDGAEDDGKDLEFSFMKNKPNTFFKELLDASNANGNGKNAVANRNGNSTLPKLAAHHNARSDGKENTRKDSEANGNDTAVGKVASPPKSNLFSEKDVEEDKSGAAKSRQLPSLFKSGRSNSGNGNTDTRCDDPEFPKNVDPLKDICTGKPHVFKTYHGNRSTNSGVRNTRKMGNSSKYNDKSNLLGSTEYFADFNGSAFKQNVSNRAKKESTWKVFSDEEGTKVNISKANGGRYFGGVPTQPSLLLKKSTDGTAAPPKAKRLFGETTYSEMPPRQVDDCSCHGTRNGYGNGNSNRNSREEKWILDFHPKGGLPINKHNNNNKYPRQVPRHNVNYIISQARDMLTRVEKCEKDLLDTYSMKIQEEKASHKRFLVAKKQHLKAKCVSRQWTAFRTNVHDLKDDIREFLASFY